MSLFFLDAASNHHKNMCLSIFIKHAVCRFSVKYLEANFTLACTRWKHDDLADGTRRFSNAKRGIRMLFAHQYRVLRGFVCKHTSGVYTSVQYGESF